MKLHDSQEAENTREKITRLEREYEQAKVREMPNPDARETVLFGIRRMINQMKEDVLRFERDSRIQKMKDQGVQSPAR
jgi:hypothetical protein